MLRLLTPAVVLGSALVLSAPAHAMVGRYVTETVSWSPQTCVSIHEPDPNTNRTTVFDGLDCGPGGFTTVSFFAPVNTYAGIDPVMGSNVFISCSLSDSQTGATYAVDRGYSGDGHDINCLRKVDSGNQIA